MNQLLRTLITVMFVVGLACLLAFPGCSRTSSGKVMHSLTAQTKDGVTLTEVQVTFVGQKIPFGLVNQFGKSWFPVRYEAGDNFIMDVSWQERSEDAICTSTVTIVGPKDADRSRFQGVILTYSKTNGWVGESDLQ